MPMVTNEICILEDDADILDCDSLQFKVLIFLLFPGRVPFLRLPVIFF